MKHTFQSVLNQGLASYIDDYLSVHVLSANAVWHRARKTYPARADTYCNKKDLPCDVFATGQIDFVAYPDSRKCSECYP